MQKVCMWHMIFAEWHDVASHDPWHWIAFCDLSEMVQVK